MSELSGMPNNVTFNIYDSETAPTPVALQTFSRGEWSADYNFSKFTILPQRIVRFNVEFSNTDTLTRDMELWIEIELDGVVKGVRERIENEAWALFSHDTKWREGNYYDVPTIYYNEGNVGIGTATPDTALHLYSSNLDPFTFLHVEKTRQSHPNYYFRINADQFEIIRDDRVNFSLTGNGWLGLGNQFPNAKLEVVGDLMISSNWLSNGDLFTVKPDGKVGIGQTSAKAKLHINDSGRGELKLLTETGEFGHDIGYNGGSDNIFSFSHTGSETGFTDFTWNSTYGSRSLLTIKNTGNVGIGTTNPNYKLDVEGYVEAYGYYTGDIVFQKEGKKLWRMFEDEEGLYLENLKTGKVYRFILKEVEKD